MCKCICCGKDDWRQGYNLPKFLFGIKAKVHSCKTCGLGKTVPKPAVNVSYYQENDKYDSLFVGKEQSYKKFAQSLLSSLPNMEPNSQKCLLDIGCGGGFLVQAASEMGFQSSGIEANEGMVKWARERGIQVQKGDVQQKLETQDKYDIIVLSAVLEHVSDPKHLLKDCRALLKHNGLILVSQASYDGLLPRLFPWGWYGWQPHEHFWHFTPSSFAKLASACGLTMTFCKRNSLEYRYYLSGGLKVVVGRNFATVIARIGEMIRQGDNFDCILKAGGGSE